MDINPSFDITDVIACIDGEERKGNVTQSGLSISNVAELFPNPATHSIVVIYSQEISEGAQIQIFNFAGQSILENKEKSEEGFISIDVSSFQPGIYFIKVNSSNYEILRSKLVIIR